MEEDPPEGMEEARWEDDCVPDAEVEDEAV